MGSGAGIGASAFGAGGKCKTGSLGMESGILGGAGIDAFSPEDLSAIRGTAFSDSVPKAVGSFGKESVFGESGARSVAVVPNTGDFVSGSIAFPWFSASDPAVGTLSEAEANAKGIGGVTFSAGADGSATDDLSDSDAAACESMAGAKAEIDGGGMTIGRIMGGRMSAMCSPDGVEGLASASGPSSFCVPGVVRATSASPALLTGTAKGSAPGARPDGISKFGKGSEATPADCAESAGNEPSLGRESALDGVAGEWKCRPLAASALGVESSGVAATAAAFPSNGGAGPECDASKSGEGGCTEASGFGAPPSGGAGEWSASFSSCRGPSLLDGCVET